MQRYNIVQYLCIIMCIALIGVYGCKGTKEINQTKDNTKANKNYIYGQGSSSSFEAAKQYAIQDLATNLQVSIKYSMQQNTQQQDNAMQTDGLSRTFLESKIKDIPSIEVEKTWKKGNNIYVLVRVDRSVLEGAIMNRIQNAEQQLQAMLSSCQTLAFYQYKKFKRMFGELQNDITLYQILTKNMGYGNAAIATFQNALSTFPAYAISWDLHDIQEYEKETKAILVSELSKFIKIDKQAKRTLHITTNSDNIFRLFLHFKDCENNPENTIQIDTHASKKDMLQGTQRTRLGAIIYKAIEASY